MDSFYPFLMDVINGFGEANNSFIFLLETKELQSPTHDDILNANVPSNGNGMNSNPEPISLSSSSSNSRESTPSDLGIILESEDPMTPSSPMASSTFDQPTSI